MQNLQITTRKEAKALGLPKYYTGVPCSRGHDKPRRTKDGKCPACRNMRKARAAKRKPRYIVRQAAKAAREKAAANGDLHFTGLPCGRCGGTSRYTKGGGCAACRSDRSDCDPDWRLRRGPRIKAEGPPTFVYVFSAGEFCKVGVAGDPALRRYQLQHACPIEISQRYVTGSMPQSLAVWVERTAHALLTEHRTFGEWFRVSPIEAVNAVDVAMVFS